MPLGKTDIVAFYRQHAPEPDGQGRKLDTIWAWPDSKLETCHNFIQVLFPLPESSRYLNTSMRLTRQGRLLT